MTERTITVKREGDSLLRVEIPVCDCEIDDFQMAMQMFLVGWKKEREQFLAKKNKPCGCNDAR